MNNKLRPLFRRPHLCDVVSYFIYVYISAAKQYLKQKCLPFVTAAPHQTIYRLSWRRTKASDNGRPQRRPLSYANVGREVFQPFHRYFDFESQHIWGGIEIVEFEAVKSPDDVYETFFTQIVKR